MSLFRFCQKRKPAERRGLNSPLTFQPLVPLPRTLRSEPGGGDPAKETAFSFLKTGSKQACRASAGLRAARATRPRKVPSHPEGQSGARGGPGPRFSGGVAGTQPGSGRAVRTRVHTWEGLTGHPSPGCHLTGCAAAPRTWMAVSNGGPFVSR